MNCVLHKRRGSRRDERGYALLALLLTMALLIIFAAALVPAFKFDLQRDREEEMIHRGTQYSRAIRGYYKKFGRYPVKIEDLESTNNLKFLRKRYKDPTNCAGGQCQDFKLLHFGEVRLTMAMGMPAATITNSGAPGFTQSTGPAQSTTLSGNGGMGTNTVAAFGSNQAPGQVVGPDSSSAGGDGSNAPVSSGPDNSGVKPGDGTSGSPGDGGNTGSPGGLGSGQVFGGGPIVGVTSYNKKDTIREFNHKKKYNEWQFIYDPGTDRGGLLTTPNQPPLTPFGQQGTQNVNGQNGGIAPTGLQNGLQNNPNPPANGQPSTPSDPNNPPQQQ